MYEEIVNGIIGGRRLHRGDDVSFLVHGNLEELKKGANHIREAACGSRADLCTIINGRAGQCSENCKFCAQSSHHGTGAEAFLSGANATITGDMLTTSGNNTVKDIDMLSGIGFDLSQL